MSRNYERGGGKNKDVSRKIDGHLEIVRKITDGMRKTVINKAGGAMKSMIAIVVPG